MIVNRYTSHDQLDASSYLAVRWGIKTPLRDPVLTDVFIGMQIFGWVGYTLILWTVFLSPKITRHPSWVNFCLCWLLSCVSYVLLFLAGEKGNPNPTHILCLIQASLVYAAPPLTSSATLALIVHLWFNIRTVVFKVETRHQRYRDFLLCVFPYIPAMVFFFWVLWYGLRNPKDVMLADSYMYCSVGNTYPGRASAIYVCLVLAAAIGIEAVIATTLYRNWRSYTRSSRHSFAMIIRVVLFTCFGFLSIIISLVYLSHTKHGAVANLFMGLLPVLSFVIFGTQLDLLHVWFFCLPKPAEIPQHRNPVLRPLLLQHDSSSSSVSSVGSVEWPPSSEKPMEGPLRSSDDPHEADIADTRPPTSPARPPRQAPKSTGDERHQDEESLLPTRSFTV